jgi:hypothetical protein
LFASSFSAAPFSLLRLALLSAWQLAERHQRAKEQPTATSAPVLSPSNAMTQYDRAVAFIQGDLGRDLVEDDIYKEWDIDAYSDDRAFGLAPVDDDDDNSNDCHDRAEGDVYRDDLHMVDASSGPPVDAGLLDMLALVITSQGLPKGASMAAPAWTRALGRFGDAMNALVESHTRRLMPSWHNTGMRLRIDNPADARRLIGDLDALAARSPDSSDFYSSLALAQAIETAAREAAAVAVEGLTDALASQAPDVRRLRAGAFDAQEYVRCAFESIEAAAAATTPRGRTTVCVVMQALRSTLVKRVHLEGSALRQAFYSEVVASASAFGAMRPPHLVEASAAGFAMLERMQKSTVVEAIIEILLERDLGLPLSAPQAIYDCLSLTSAPTMIIVGDSICLDGPPERRPKS